MRRTALAIVASILVLCGYAPAAQAATNDSIILVIDASRSMQGKKLDIAQSVGKKFLNDLPNGVRASLVTFNSDAVNTVALTSRIPDVVEALANVKAQGNTALYDGVVRAIDLASNPDNTRLVVLTDGYDTSSDETAATVKKAIADSGISLDVVAIAATDANLKVMASFTDAGNGRVFQADDDTKLEAVLSRALEQAAPAPLPSASQSARPTPEPTTPMPTPSNTAVSLSQLVTGPIGATIALAVLCGLGFVGIRRLIANRRKLAMDKSLEDYDTRRSAFGLKSSANDPFIDIASRNTRKQDPEAAAVSIRSRAFPVLAERIERADMKITPQRWIMMCILAFLGIFFLVQLATGAWFLAVLLGTGIVYGAQNALLNSRTAQHLRLFESGLADFLVLIASGLRAGMSFAQSVDSAAAEGMGPVERQMRRALGEVRVGSTLEGALARVAERMNSDDLRWSIAALQIQRDVGGNLSKILDTAATTIRNRAELKREVQALSAEGQLSAYVLLALPLGVFGFLGLTRPEYVQVFWTQRSGMVMLAVFSLLVTSGWFWIKNIVAIEV